MAHNNDTDSARRPTEQGRSAPRRRPPSLLLVGISHHSAAFDELEQAALNETGVRHGLRRLSAAGEIHEGAILATCNRTEVYLVARRQEAAAELGRRLLTESSTPEAGTIYIKRGLDAAAHLFRVAAGIDSLMVGEVQILNQVKQALNLAVEERIAGTHLGKVFGSALRAGKRARSETDISQGAVSVSYAALGLARKIYSDFREHTLLVVGAGETGMLAARHFAEEGVQRLLVVNRNSERAAALARDVGGEAVPWNELPRALAESDIAITATSAPHPVIEHDMVEAALRGRGNRQLVFIDIALPRDVGPRVNDLEGVFVHDMTALDTIVQRNLDRRRREIPKVEAIVTREVERFETWQSSLQAGPTIHDLRRHFEAIRAAEIQALSSHLEEDELKRVERVTRNLINRLLHRPQVNLRRPQPGAGGSERLTTAARELFGLDGGEEDERDPADRNGGPPE